MGSGQEALPEVTQQGEGEEGGEKSAFGVISPEPPAAEKSSDLSGFSFINSLATEEGRKGEVGNSHEGVDFSPKTEETDSSPKKNSSLTQEAPTNATATGVNYSRNTPSYSRPTDSPQPAFCNSSGVQSPVPGPISPPLVVSSPAGREGGGGRASVGKQQPTSGKKKKKRKIVR